jgi:hypothetical protein
LKTRPADLTALARNDNGALPAERASRVIEGTQLVKAHESPEMPAWGFRLCGTGPTPAGCVRALTEHLKGIQVNWRGQLGFSARRGLED